MCTTSEEIQPVLQIQTATPTSTITPSYNKAQQDTGRLSDNSIQYFIDKNTEETQLLSINIAASSRCCQHSLMKGSSRYFRLISDSGGWWASYILSHSGRLYPFQEEKPAGQWAWNERREQWDDTYRDGRTCERRSRVSSELCEEELRVLLRHSDECLLDTSGRNRDV